MTPQGSKEECREFLDWALPRMELRAAGFRRVRGQVCKRIARRRRELGLPDLAAYGGFLDSHPDEWAILDSLCRITISRFCRDRSVFSWLRKTGLPKLAKAAMAQGRDVLSCWSAGCGSGEEPYTLRIMWDRSLGALYPALRLDIVATDMDRVVLQRARRAVYPGGSLRELPPSWVEEAFSHRDDRYRLRDPIRKGVRFLRQDIRREMPPGPFDLVLCRNLAFTYFARDLQDRILAHIAHRMRDGGILVVGRKEVLSETGHPFDSAGDIPGVYRLQRDNGPAFQQGVGTP